MQVKDTNVQYGAIPLQVSSSSDDEEFQDAVDYSAEVSVVEREIYDPPFNANSRRSTQIVAIFNLLSTIVGGGTLSLPYAFSKCGWLVGSLLTIVSVIISLISLETLCNLSRKLGCSSYSEVMEKSIGKGWADITSYLLIFMLFFVVIAFMVLEKDIAGDILDYFLPGNYGIQYKSSILIILTIISFPVMIADNLYALRHVSYLGITSVLLLLGVIISKAITINYLNPNLFKEKSHSIPNSIGDILYSLPIILIAFLCQFNVLGVYSNLYQPTSVRMKQVLYVSIPGSGLIYIIFGIGGYLFAYENTFDNILNNFSSQDPSLIIARCGLLFTIICQIPMVVLPCRQSIIELIHKLSTDNHNNHLNSNNNNENHKLQPKIDTKIINNNNKLNYLVTFLLVLSCLLLSELVPGVSTIWSIAGSSVSFVLAFLLPSLAYVRYKQNLIIENYDFRYYYSRIMIIVSIGMIILCSYQSINKLLLK